MYLNVGKTTISNKEMTMSQKYPGQEGRVFVSLEKIGGEYKNKD
jgi:hypothetical protein